MDEMQNQPTNPRRRRRSQLEVFKEAYLPAIIAAVAILLIVVFIIGSISRSIQAKKTALEESQKASIAEEQKLTKLTQEAEDLIQRADLLASEYDYDGALALLDTFSGDETRFEILTQKRAELEDAKSQMVLWEDPNNVLNLSFQMLIADASRAFSNASYGTAYNRNFITTDEFSLILQQLYTNGYVLVDMDDFVSAEMDDLGEITYKTKPLYLPIGKKPLMITQTQVNYYTYMIDGDGDKFPDKDGAGFASKLILNDAGEITCQMVDADGNTITGDYDLVPILETFIANNPDFSYRGARATLAVSGYDGVFGYRTNASAKNHLDEMAYEEEIYGAQEIVDALRQMGYQIACYTYGNEAYGEMTADQIRADLSGWSSEVSPVLGEVNTIVFAQNSDISTGAIYSGEKYEILRDAGFCYYIGFSAEGACWTNIAVDYVRMGRLMVSGSNIAHHPEWFSGVFDATSILDSTRGDVPA